MQAPPRRRIRVECFPQSISKARFPARIPAARTLSRRVYCCSELRARLVTINRFKFRAIPPKLLVVIIVRPLTFPTAVEVQEHRRGEMHRTWKRHS